MLFTLNCFKRFDGFIRLNNVITFPKFGVVCFKNRRVYLCLFLKIIKIHFSNGFSFKNDKLNFFQCFSQ